MEKSYDATYLTHLTDRWNKLSYPLIAPLIARASNGTKFKDVLDFGAGAGTYASALAEFGTVKACDVSEDSVAMCRTKYAEAFQIRNAVDLPDEAFDFIFSTEVLEHIKDFEDALQNLHRALRPGGTLLLTTTCYAGSIFTMLYDKRANKPRESLRWFMGYFRGKRYRDAFIEQWCFQPLGGHYHGFRKGELLAAFRRSGFIVKDSGFFYAVEPLQLYFLQRPFSDQKTAAHKIAYLTLCPINLLLKVCGLFANNVYVIAHKD